MDSAAEQPTSANARVVINTRDTLRERASVDEVEEKQEVVGEISRRDSLSQQFQTFERKSSDEIDSLLASVPTDVNAFLSYFDAKQPKAPNQWQPLQVNASLSFPPSIASTSTDTLEVPPRIHM